MQTDLAEPYKFGPLDRYTFRERLIIRFTGLFAYVMLKLVGMTLRYQVTNSEFEEEIVSAGKQPIYTFWHDRMLAGTYFFRDRGIIVLSSQSFDSEFTARCIQRFGFGIVKGSSTRGAVQGLVGLIRAMKKGAPAGFTVDGPKGPRYVAKSGPILLAKKTGNPVLPFVVECRSFWRVRNWDRLQIPMPFSRSNIIFSKPIYVDMNAKDEDLEQKRSELQNALDEAVVQGEKWRDDHSN
jgi:lysophospholipid acyltransferase (LPLAT)-like uncharacterized protein